MKKLFLIGIISISALCFLPTNTNAATINANSCSYADVSAAINSAQVGDTVQVPAGTCTWTSSVTINKTLTIKGAGIGNTILIDNGNQHGAGIFNCNIPNNNRVTISDMEIQAGISQSHSWSIDGVIIFTGNAQDHMKFRIHHMKFTGMKAYAIRVFKIYGLIDNNQFINQQASATSVFVNGDGSAAFLRPVELGGANAVFVENNSFLSDQAFNAWLEQWDGTRLVIRHNTMNNVWISSHGYDDVGSGYRGPVSIEYYENTADCDDNTGPNYCFGALAFRGGTGVIFNNTWTETGGATFSGGTAHGIGLVYYGLWTAVDNKCGNTDMTWRTRCLSYPCMDQPGRTGITQNPLYIWNNVTPRQFINVVATVANNNDGYDCDTIPKVYNDSSKCNSFENADVCFIRENRDYYLSVKPGYTPYVYPHPLSVEAVDTTPPAVPTGVAVE